MQLLTLAIALQGVGFSTEVMAMQGFLPAGGFGAQGDYRIRRLRRM